MTFADAEAGLAVIGVAATMLGCLWGVGRLIARGQDAPADISEAKQEAADGAIAATRHAQLSGRLDRLEKDVERMGDNQVVQDRRLGEVERTMATRGDIKELSIKLDTMKKDIVSEISMLLGVGREP